jgi:hypothetical protein
MILLELTELKGDGTKPIWINFDQVRYISTSNSTSKISIDSGKYIYVKEKPEEIFKLLNQIEEISHGEYIGGMDAQ